MVRICGDWSRVQLADLAFPGGRFKRPMRPELGGEGRASALLTRVSEALPIEQRELPTR